MCVWIRGSKLPQEFISFKKFELVINNKELTKGLRKVGNQVKNTAKGLIQQAGTGRKYGSHTASSPGMAPASLTGLLAAAMKVSVSKQAVRVTDLMYYAVMLESGTKKLKGSIAPRPFLTAALEQTDVQSILSDALQNIIDSR